MSATPFADLNALAAHFRAELATKKYILLYAYNGTGKTRLSTAFKDLGKNGDERDTLYFNAFTEDLFSWHNDLDGAVVIVGRALPPEPLGDLAPARERPAPVDNVASVDPPRPHDRVEGTSHHRVGPLAEHLAARGTRQVRRADPRRLNTDHQHPTGCAVGLGDRLDRLDRRPRIGLAAAH